MRRRLMVFFVAFAALVAAFMVYFAVTGMSCERRGKSGGPPVSQATGGTGLELIARDDIFYHSTKVDLCHVSPMIGEFAYTDPTPSA